VGPDPDPKPFKFCTNNLQQEIFGPKDEYRFTLTVNWGLIKNQWLKVGALDFYQHKKVGTVNFSFRNPSKNAA
jgi:hypothetical protein